VRHYLGYGNGAEPGDGIALQHSQSGGDGRRHIAKGQ